MGALVTSWGAVMLLGCLDTHDEPVSAPHRSIYLLVCLRLVSLSVPTATTVTGVEDGVETTQVDDASAVTAEVM